MFILDLAPVSMDWAKTPARRGENKNYIFGFGALYTWGLYGIHPQSSAWTTHGVDFDVIILTDV